MFRRLILIVHPWRRIDGLGTRLESGMDYRGSLTITGNWRKRIGTHPTERWNESMSAGIFIEAK